MAVGTTLFDLTWRGLFHFPQENTVDILLISCCCLRRDDYTNGDERPGGHKQRISIPFKRSCFGGPDDWSDSSIFNVSSTLFVVIANLIIKSAKHTDTRRKTGAGTTNGGGGGGEKEEGRKQLFSPWPLPPPPPSPLPRKAGPMHSSQPKLRTRKKELQEFYLDRVTWQTLTDGSDVKHMYSRCSRVVGPPSLPRVINHNPPPPLPYHSIKNFRFYRLLRWKMIRLPIFTTSLIHFFLYFLNLGVKCFAKTRAPG